MKTKNKRFLNTDDQEKLMHDIQDKIIGGDYNILDVVSAIAGIFVWLIVVEASEVGWARAKLLANDLLKGSMQRIEDLSRFEIPKGELN